MCENLLEMHCEQIRSAQLFSEEEISKIKRTRENLDHKIGQSTAVIKDYVEYIKYEQTLITTIKERAKEKKTPEIHTILTSIADHIKIIYAQALSKFPNNLRFWDEYIKFLHTAKFTSDISVAFDQMLQHHSGNLEAWIRAIRWEYAENFNYEHFKNLLMRAQKHHPDSEKLILFEFRIELENKCQFPEIEALQNADAVYMNAKKFFPNFDFFIDMLNIVDKISYASELLEKILFDMEILFKHKEILWHTLAQRALNGQSAPDNVDDDDQTMIKTECKDGKLNVKPIKIETSVRKQIENCSKVYQDAIKVVDTPKMWNYYLSTMIELNNDLSTQSSLKRFVLKQAFEAADCANHMQEDHYIQYIELLYSNNPKDEAIDHVLQKSTGIYKNSQKLWLYRLRYYIFEDNFKKLEDIFKDIKLLEGSGAELWRTYLVYLRSRRRSETEEAFKYHLEELAHQPYRSFNTLKAQMIELFATTESMDKARTLYELFTRLYPNCYEVHEMMADIESKQLKRNRENEQFCLDRMIKNFGQTRTSVWLRYMRYEQYADKPENVNELHEKALKTLKPELLAEFNELYNEFINGTA